MQMIRVLCRLSALAFRITCFLFHCLICFIMAIIAFILLVC